MERTAYKYRFCPTEEQVREMARTCSWLRQVVCAERLNAKVMLANPRLAKSMGEVSWGDLRRQLQYQAQR